jgi:class 3 adenylate cyclase
MSAFGGHHSGKSGHQEMSANDPKHPGPFRRLAGIAVHIGARVAALAASGEVLVSQTVRDLVAGSGLAFEDRGTHALKGVPNEWRLFRAMVN